MARFIRPASMRPYGDEVWSGDWRPSPYRRAFAGSGVAQAPYRPHFPSCDNSRSLMSTELSPFGRSLRTSTVDYSRGKDIE